MAVGREAIRLFHAAATTPEQSLEAGRALLARAAADGHVLIAHNVGFDGLVAKLAWELSFAQYFDTTGYARYLGVGASLENVAALFGYRKIEAPPFTTDTLRDPHARSTLARYNAADVAIARLVYRAALDDHGYPDTEFAINDLTSRMNIEGLRIDTARAAELAAQAATLHASAMSELASSYAFDTSALRRPDAVRTFARRSWGLSLGSLDKRDGELRSAIRMVQEAERFFRLRDRALTLSRAVQKLQSYASVDDGRVYGFLRYYGAHTGRFAAGGRDANKFNIHQLFKVKNRARIPELGAERGVIVPPDGKNFVAADLATVEARVVAWVADSGPRAACPAAHRAHAARRSFISLARTDGARPDILKLVTHGSDGQRNMMDLYSTLDWSVLCAEVVKLRIERVERGKVIALPLAKAVGDNQTHASVEDQVLATPDDDPPRIAVGDQFRRRDSNSTESGIASWRARSSFTRKGSNSRRNLAVVLSS